MIVVFVARLQSLLVAHLASGCNGLAEREYRRRHDRMGLRIYWQL